MADAEKLLRDAYYAFQSITPGSADERRSYARAERLARRILRKYPASSEAEQANSILRQLGIHTELTQTRNLIHTHATPESPHTLHMPNARTKTTEQMSERLAGATNDPAEISWQDIQRKVLALSSGQKKAIFVVLIILGGLFSTMPFLLLGIAYYVIDPSLLRKHLYKLLSSFD